MKLKFAVSLGSALLVLNLGAFAIDPEKQAVIDRYKAPFAVYLAAISDLGVGARYRDKQKRILSRRQINSATKPTSSSTNLMPTRSSLQTRKWCNPWTTIPTPRRQWKITWNL